MTRQQRVLIIGAGPCGLMTACELRRRGVDVSIVEASPGAQRGTRAILLWSPSLRLFRDLGVLAEAERRGVTIAALSYHLSPGNTVRLPLSAPLAPLILPQEDTDALLDAELQRLGGKVEWGQTLVSLTQAGDEVVVGLRAADGTVSERRVDWLIGADGLRSKTRELLGIPFEGQRLDTTWLLAEGKITGDYERDAVHYFLGRQGVVLVAPLPGGRVRISGALPDGKLDEGTAQRLLDERAGGTLKVASLDTNTTFISQERIAARMRQGRCFLVGDAAHTHSVVGGQGLNLGFGDARNLAWKLAGVLAGRLAPAVLDSYSVERRAAAEQVVRATTRMARQAVLGPVAAWLRNTLFAAAHRTGVLAKTLPPTLSGWKLTYPETLIGAGPNPRARFLPPPGGQSPDWAPAVSSYEREVFELVTIGPEQMAARDQAAGLAAKNGSIVTHRHVVADRQGFLLLRPDGFVAASGRTGDLGWLGDAFAKLAGTNKELQQ